MAERHPDPVERPATSSVAPEPRISSVARSLIVILALIVAATWLMDIEHSLPDVRAPRDPGSSEVLGGHALMLPGYHNIGIVDAEITGDWLLQVIGDSDWLVTDQANDRLRTAFYGTEIYLVARVGPEAGRAYVRVNNRTVDHLASDETGSYVNLWAGEAADQAILVASGLAHGEHLVEITSAGDGEVAVSGFDVVAQTPFYWAFVFIYAGIAGGLFLAVRRLLYTLNQSSERVPVSQASFPADASH